MCHSVTPSRAISRARDAWHGEMKGNQTQPLPSQNALWSNLNPATAWLHDCVAKDVHTLIPGICDYGILHGKEKLRLQMKLMLLIHQLTSN